MTAGATDVRRGPRVGGSGLVGPTFCFVMVTGAPLMCTTLSLSLMLMLSMDAVNDVLENVADMGGGVRYCTGCMFEAGLSFLSGRMVSRRDSTRLSPFSILPSFEWTRCRECRLVSQVKGSKL